MIRHGIDPIIEDNRDLSYHKTYRKYGSTNLGSVPIKLDFFNGWMPNQEDDGAPFECAAYGLADSARSEEGIEYTPDFSFAKGLQIGGQPSTQQGCDVRDMLKGGQVYGLLKKEDATISSKEFGEAYAGDWRKWPLDADAKAEPNRRGKYLNLYPTSGMDYFDSIRAAMWNNYTMTNKRRPALLGTPWLNEWSSLPQSGIVPSTFTYNGNPNAYNWHLWVIDGFDMIGNTEYARAKTWQGENYGYGGHSFYPREVINGVMKIQYTEAYMAGVHVDPNDAQAVGNTIQVIYAQIIAYLQRELAMLSSMHANAI